MDKMKKVERGKRSGKKNEKYLLEKNKVYKPTNEDRKEKKTILKKERKKERNLFIHLFIPSLRERTTYSEKEII